MARPAACEDPMHNPARFAAIQKPKTVCVDPARTTIAIHPTSVIATARTWPIGTTLTVTNPKNGRSITVRINDTGPWGIAYKMGARLDLARGAARQLGMTASQYVCVA